MTSPLSDPLTELERQVDAMPDGAGAAWTVAHCAQSIEYSVTGYPRLRSWLFRATIGPVAKRKFLRAGRMSHDLAAPVAGAPDLPLALSLDEARARLHAAVAAFRAHPGPFPPHLAYGPCTREEYADLHRLHVENHLRAGASGRPAPARAR